MDSKEKISVKDLIEILKTLFKDTYHADARKFRNEVHVKFPNGQKFMIDIYDHGESDEREKREELYERLLAELSSEEYNKKFEKGLLSWIRSGIWIKEKAETETKDNQAFVTLKTGQEYIITIQRK